MLALVRKLLGMPPAEIAFRLREAWHARLEATLFKVGAPQPSERRLRAAARYPLTLDQWWLTDPEYDRAASFLREHHPAYCRSVVDRAERLIRGEYEFFGRKVTYSGAIDWQADPVSGRPWPCRFHSAIDIFSGDTGAGDVKYVWELNRFLDLPALGKAWRLTRDERYPRAALALLDDWIEANPYKTGVNWSSALELAVRALAWLDTLALIDAASRQDAALPAIRASLLLHAQHISEHLSTYFSPYNHLIGEAAALYAVGLATRCPGRSEAWLHKGWAVLDTEAPRQFFADGGAVEQAIGYHHFTLGFYLQAALLRRRSGQPGGAVEAAVERACEYSMHMMRPDRRWPMIGDADEGRALDLAQDDPWDFRPYLALGAVLYDRSDFKYAAGPFPPDAVWLVGADGASAYERLAARTPTNASILLASSGYAVTRSGWDEHANYAVLDCGEIAHGVSHDAVVSAAHGHADALSYEVVALGSPVLVDPGFYTYNGPVEWHRYFRESAAHNVLVVDDQPQACYRGRLKWSDGPRVTVHQWLTTDRFDFIEASHDAYRSLPGDVGHRRSLLFIKPDIWLVRDEVTGSGVHQLDRYFHCANAPVLSPAIRGFWVPGAGAGAWVQITDASEMTLAGEPPDGPGGGWAAVGYERKVPTPVVRLRCADALPRCLWHLIVAAPSRSMVEPVSLTVATMADGEERVGLSAGETSWQVRLLREPGTGDRPRHVEIVDGASR